MWAERNAEDTGKDGRGPAPLAGLRTSRVNPTASRGWLEMHMGPGQRRLAARPGFEAGLRSQQDVCLQRSLRTCFSTEVYEERRYREPAAARGCGHERGTKHRACSCPGRPEAQRRPPQAPRPRRSDAGTSTEREAWGAAHRPPTPRVS